MVERSEDPPASVNIRKRHAINEVLQLEEVQNVNSSVTANSAAQAEIVSSPPMSNGISERSAHFFVVGRQAGGGALSRSRQTSVRKRNSTATDGCFNAYLFTFLFISGLNWRPDQDHLLSLKQPNKAVGPFAFSPRDPIYSSSIHPNSNGYNREKTPTKMSGNNEEERDFFDPMVGRFRINPAADLQSFFKSNLRWRGEEELAQHAWSQPPQSDVRVNMLLTEQLRPQDWSNCRNDPAGPSCSSMALGNNGGAGGQENQPPRSDPSLMDYDAIDVYWRQDIEQEKGTLTVAYDNTQSETPTEQQFQRDLQLLTEKSLFAPLNAEERFRYENLSKAQYTDFYRSLSVVPKGYRYEDPNTRQTPSSLFSSPTSSQASQLSPKNSDFGGYDEENPEDFFATLAKEEFEVQPLPLPTAGLQTYSNVSLCNNQSPLLHNVSLSSVVSPQNALNESFGNAFPARDLPTRAVENGSIFNLNGPAVQNVSNIERQDTFLNATAANIVNDSLEEEFSSLERVFAEVNQNAVEANTSVVENGTVPMVQNNLTSEYYYDNVSYDASEFLPATDARACRSPSSGIGSMSSSSPVSFEEMSSHQPISRFYRKLAPTPVKEHSSNDHQYFTNAPQHKVVKQEISGRDSVFARYSSSGTQQRRRGRQSKDEQLVADNELPATAEELASMTHQEIQRLMRDPKLTSAQKALIKKIRRRGRNKVAARKCRERRVYEKSTNDQEFFDEYFEEEIAASQIQGSSRTFSTFESDSHYVE